MLSGLSNHCDTVSWLSSQFMNHEEGQWTHNYHQSFWAIGDPPLPLSSSDVRNRNSSPDQTLFAREERSKVKDGSVRVAKMLLNKQMKSLLNYSHKKV